MLSMQYAPILQGLNHTPQSFRIGEGSRGDWHWVAIFYRAFDQSIFFQVVQLLGQDFLT